MKCPCCECDKVTLKKSPEEHVHCPACGHCLKTKIPPKSYYKKLSGRSARTGKIIRRKNAERTGYLSPYIQNGIKILELGCAEGQLGEAIKKKWNVRYDGIEPSGDAELARMKLNQVWKSIYDVPARAKFNLILTFHVLEHISSLDNIILKLSKHLRDDGILIIEVPHYSGNQRLPWDFHKEHIHLFGAASLSCLLERHGFQVADLGTGYFESDIYDNSLRVSAFKRNKVKYIKDDLVKRFEQFLGKHFVIYGAGGDFESFVLPYIKVPSMSALIDSSPAKWGRRIGGRSILPPKAAVRFRNQKFLIATYRYHEEIRSSLRKKGVAKSQIVSLDDILGAGK